MSITLHETQTSHLDAVPPDEAYAGIYTAIDHGDAKTALELLEHLTTDDIIWRLSSENDALDRLENNLDASQVAELKDSIVSDAIVLAANRLPAEAIAEVGAHPVEVIDASDVQPVTIRDALLMAKSWDSSNHNDTLGNLLAVMLDELPEAIAETPKQAFQLALEEGVDFAQAQQKVYAEIDHRLDRRSSVSNEDRLGNEKPLSGPDIELYEWLFNPDAEKPEYY